MLKKSSILLIIIAVMELIFALILKYQMNGLSFNDFSIVNLGNLINFFLTFLFITGVAVNSIFLGGPQKPNLWILYFLAILMIVPQVILETLILSEVQYSDSYFFGYPSKKLLFGLLFSINKFVLLYAVSTAWLFVFNRSYINYLKSIVISLLFICIAILSSFIFTFSSNNSFNEFDTKKERIGVVLGAAVWKKDQPSPIFKARIEKANLLYETGILTILQVTGGNAPGELSEAETAKQYLVKLGVDAEDILLEESTSTTSEQIKFIGKELNDNGLDIVVISDNFHLTRITEMCKFFNVRAKVIPSDLKLSWEKLVYYRFRESIALLLFWLFGI